MLRTSDGKSSISEKKTGCQPNGSHATEQASTPEQTVAYLKGSAPLCSPRLNFFESSYCCPMVANQQGVSRLIELIELMIEDAVYTAPSPIKHSFKI